jgi:mycothiol synthase
MAPGSPVQDHADLLVRMGDVVVEPLGADGIHRAIALLDGAEAATRAALVDEGERTRLRALAPPTVLPAGAEGGPHWHPVLASLAGSAVGYAGIVGDAGTVLADVALDRVAGRDGPVLRALLEAARRIAEEHDATQLEVWVRHAAESDLVAATAAGFGVARRLAVLGLALPATLPSSVRVDGGPIMIRRADEQDIDRVVALLDAAYAGTPDGGWNAARFAERAATEWFRLDDLLLAEAEDGRLVGAHWMKRRGDGVGEVYNLAVEPAARGTGVGATLLAAGVEHLAARGMHEVLLWVDLANERAVRLYGTFGFALRWEDVLLRRTLGA